MLWSFFRLRDGGGCADSLERGEFSLGLWRLWSGENERPQWELWWLFRSGYGHVVTYSTWRLRVIVKMRWRLVGHSQWGLKVFTTGEKVTFIVFLFCYFRNLKLWFFRFCIGWIWNVKDDWSQGENFSRVLIGQSHFTPAQMDVVWVWWHFRFFIKYLKQIKSKRLCGIVWGWPYYYSVM